MLRRSVPAKWPQEYVVSSYKHILCVCVCVSVVVFGGVLERSMRSKLCVRFGNVCCVEMQDFLCWRDQYVEETKGVLYMSWRQRHCIGCCAVQGMLCPYLDYPAPFV